MLSPSARLRTALLLASTWAVPASFAAEAPDATAALDRAIAAAEAALREGRPHVAETLYGKALFEGWLLMGTLERLDGCLPEARQAFRSASTFAGEDRRALQLLASAHLQMGDAAAALEILRPVARKDPPDVATRRLLAQALMASGQPAPAVKELEEARAVAPADLELAFDLAGGYLELKHVDDAARIFAQIGAARPIPQTHVLIGRTYRDHGEYELARAELRAALKQDPNVRRAHYYLGNVIVAEMGRAGLEEAIPEFQAELKVAPRDALTNLELGMALVDTHRPEEALTSLEIAARSEPPQAQAFYYLGRAQLALDRPAAAVASQRRALELAEGQGASTEARKMIHLQLGQALRKLGQTQEATPHFAEAESLAGQGSAAARERMARHLADQPDAETAKTHFVPVSEASSLAVLSASQRLELKVRVKGMLARAYLNLGVMQAQGEQHVRAAELFEKAGELDPELAQVPSSLGVAYFNAKEYDKATGPLTRALLAKPEDGGLKRMLAMAWLNARNYTRAAELLRDDAEVETDPSLQFAYGLALVKSERAAEAERVFSRLLAAHGDSAELSVLLGQASAQQGDFDAAVESLKRALRLKADVAEANATLGVIYLKQGKLAEAEEALRAELKTQPADVKSQQNLAAVLDMEQRPEEAVVLLRGVVKASPDSADARYLLGKILLGQGAVGEAVEQLEAAARLSPEDANVQYQLGRAYQKLGREEQAQKKFELFRQLKDKRRGAVP
jgi:tetratricopeptide (TPR) repeat protein